MTAPTGHSSENSTPSESLSHRQVLTILFGLMTGMLLAALDQTMVATALPVLASDLGGFDRLAWIVTAYLLAATAATPLFGKLSDVYGRQRVFQAAILIFMLGALLSGLSQSMEQLIAARSVQGIGGGGLMALAFTTIADIISPRERGRYQGYIGAVFATASIAGPLLSGTFVQNFHWRWIFLIHLPLAAVAFVVASRSMRGMRRSRSESSIDVLGAVLLIIGVVALLLLVEWGGTTYPWGSPETLALGVGTLLAIVLFIFREHVAPDPILPLELFRNRTVALSSTASFLVGAALFGGIVFLPVFLQLVTGLSPMMAGLLLTPMMAGMLVASISVGRRITTTGRYRRYPIAGSAIMAIGLLALSTMDATTNFVLSSTYMIALGLGTGMIMPVLILAVQNDVPRHHLGVATSANAFFRNLGGAIATAVFGALMNARLLMELDARLPDDADVDASIAQASPTQILALPEELRLHVAEAFGEAITLVFLAAVPIALVSIVLTWLLPERPLSSSVD